MRRTLRFVLITNDLDFPRLLAYTSQRKPSVILLRGEPLSLGKRSITAKNGKLSDVNETPISRFSVLVAILSSAIAVIPFYLVGMAEFLGNREALGLSYLSVRSAGEYIAAGAETLLIGGFLIGYFALFLVVAVLDALGLKRWYIPRNWEVGSILVIASITTVFILTRLLRDERVGSEVMRTASCPIGGKSADGGAFWLLLFTMFFVAVISIVILDKRYRLVFLIWGTIACLACLWNFGWSKGAGIAYGEFPTAEITDATARTQTVLLLDSDDKNVVVVFIKCGSKSPCPFMPVALRPKINAVNRLSNP